MVSVLHLTFVILATISACILLATILPVYCAEDDEVIDCTNGCLNGYYLPTAIISRQFRCPIMPIGCICVLGNLNVTLTCPVGTSSMQILYPPCDIKALSWSDTGIHGFEPNVFVNRFTNLEELYLSHNNVNMLHARQFAGLVNLQVLDLSSNKIVELNPEHFAEVTQITWLDLSSNDIVELHPQQFTAITVLRFLNLSNNGIVSVHPQQFSELVHLSYFYLSHNSLYKVHPQQFANQTSLLILHLSDNGIAEIHPEQFLGLTELTHLYLSNNNIVELHPQQYAGLARLEFLLLSNNYLVELPLDLFTDTKYLSLLDISNNYIQALHPQHTGHLTSLDQLYVSNNHIKRAIEGLFYYSMNLLDLSNNNLVFFQPFEHVEFDWYFIRYMSLSRNKLSTLPYGTFQKGTTILFLDLSHNYFNEFESMSYYADSFASLGILDIRSNMLQRVTYTSFQSFQESTEIWVDNAAICCFIESATCTATIPPSQFLTCGRLLSSQIQRIIMWIFGIFAIVSNVCALIYRCRHNLRQNKVQILLISNLSFSDLIMGIYMLIIASADAYYQNYFPSESWRSSITCKVAGTLSMLSSEGSVFIISIISIDRFMGIRYMYSKTRLSTRSARIVIAGLWVFAICLSILSTILSQTNPELYDNSEVCTGLPLSRSNTFDTVHTELIFITDSHEDENNRTIIVNIRRDIPTGTKVGIVYGIAVFTVLNFINVLIVMFCYIGIFVTVRQTARQAGRNQSQKEELQMAIKMGLIVLTDMMCWLPIIILSILVQTGRQTVPPHVYTWIVTFVMPINSAINPFLYTLATAVFDSLRKKNEVYRR